MTVSKLLTLKEKNLRLLPGLYKRVDFILVTLKFCLTGKKGTLGIMSSFKEAGLQEQLFCTSEDVNLNTEPLYCM